MPPCRRQVGASLRRPQRWVKRGTFSVLVAPPKQARAARPGAPQAPQAARSAAAGGGQQVREIKRHFRFRTFATNVKIRCNMSGG